MRLIATRSLNSARRSPKRSAAPNTRSSATKTPSRPAISAPPDSRSGYPASTRASTACAAKTKRSPAILLRTRPRPPTPQRSMLSPINSAESSRRVTPTEPKHYCASSSPSYASTAATRSCPPTASAHPWFAHRQVQWSQPGSNRRPPACKLSGWCFVFRFELRVSAGFCRNPGADSMPNYARISAHISGFGHKVGFVPNDLLASQAASTCRFGPRERAEGACRRMLRRNIRPYIPSHQVAPYRSPTRPRALRTSELRG